MSNEKYIINLDVYDFEKLYKPTKVYVYHILVSWSDDSKFIVYRSYSNFEELQKKLSSIYKKEIRVNKLATKDIPELPEKIIFGRSNVKSVAIKRLDILDKYCKKLISLQNEISKCESVLKFFESTPGDVEKSLKMDRDKRSKGEKRNKSSNDNSIPVSTPKAKHEYKVKQDFKGASKSELSVSKGERVNVLEKNMNGWWFVESIGSAGVTKGFVPSAFLERAKQDGETDATDTIQTDIPEPHIVTSDYQANKPDEISVRKANYVLVIEKNVNGFWKVKLGNLVGLVPAVFLIPNVSLINKIRSTMHLIDSWGLQKDDSSPKPSNLPSNKSLTLEKYQNFLNNGNKINKILMNPALKQTQQKEDETKKPKSALVRISTLVK